MYKHSIYFVYILHIGSYIDGELHDVTILDVCVCVCVCVWRMVVIWRRNCLLFTLGYWKNLVIVYLIQFTVISQNHVYLPLSIDMSSQ